MAKRKLMKLIVTAARIVITIVIFIFWILVILIVPNLLKDYGIKIVVLNLFAFLFFFMYLNTYLHELGHVMAGKLMKIGIQKVMIGDGRELIRTNLFGFPLIITNSIKGGFTFPSHIKGRLLRLRVSIFTAGGILAQALFIFICILVRRLEPGAFYLSKGFDLSNSFVISNLILISFSSIPMKTWFRGIKIHNDGLSILRTLFLKDESIREIQVSGIINEAHEYFEKKEYEKAVDVYRSCIEQYPTEIIPKVNLSAALIRSLKLEEAKKILVDLNEEKHDKQYDFLIYNNLAWLLLLQNDQVSLVEADKFSKMAFDLNPKVPYVRTTRSCVLIERGQIDEGINLLKKNVHLNKAMDNEWNSPVGFFFIAYAYYMKGEKDKTRKYLKHLEGYEKLDADYKYLFNLVRRKTRNFEGV